MKKSIQKSFPLFGGFLITGVLCVSLFSPACSDGKGPAEVPAAAAKTAESEDLSDEPVTQATCLECHPAMKDGGFNIDLKDDPQGEEPVGRNNDVGKGLSVPDEKKEETR